MSSDSSDPALGKDKNANAEKGQDKPQEEKTNNPPQFPWVNSSDAEESSIQNEPVNREGHQASAQKTTYKEKITKWYRETPPDTKSIVINMWMAIFTGAMTVFTGVMVFLTLILAGIGIWQARIASQQYQAAIDAVNAANKSVEVAEKQWQVAKDALQDARDGAGAAEARADKLIKANEELAKAAKTQADTALIQTRIGEKTANAGAATARAAEQGVRVSIENAKDDQRAWVGVVGMSGVQYDQDSKRVYIKEGQPIRFTAEVVNSGKSIASEFISNVSVSSIPINRPFQPTYGQIPYQSTGVLQPGMRIFLPSPEDTTIPTKGHITAWSNDTYRLYFYGKLSYLDAYKRKHNVTFCAYLTPDLSSFRACETYNTAD